MIDAFESAGKKERSSSARETPDLIDIDTELPNILDHSVSLSPGQSFFSTNIWQ